LFSLVLYEHFHLVLVPRRKRGFGVKIPDRYVCCGLGNMPVCPHCGFYISSLCVYFSEKTHLTSTFLNSKL
jgi:hypothetical protein